MLDFDADKLINLWKFAKKRFYYYDGLIALLLLGNLLYYVAQYVVGPHIIPALKYFQIVISGDFAHIVCLFGIFIVNFVILIVWFKKRSLPKFCVNESGILFAPSFSDELDDDVDKLFTSIKYELKSKEIDNTFKIVKLSPNIKISSIKEASLVLRKSLSTTIIWGLIDHSVSGEGKVVQFSRISFLFISSKPATVVIHKDFGTTLISPFLGSKFKTTERTQSVDRQIIASNVGLIVRDIIGINLVVEGRYKEAIQILLPLSVELKIIALSKKTPAFSNIYQQVKSDCAKAMSLDSTQEYSKYLYSDKLYDIPKNVLEIWLANSEQAIKLDPQNSMHYLLKGIYLFLFGKIEDSIRTIKEADGVAPRALATPCFSLAFLYNYIGDFKNSHNQYRLGLAKKTSHDPEMVSQCLYFIRQSIVKYPDKKQLRFALGLFELKRGNPTIGIMEVELFVREASELSNLSRFLEEANKILAQKEDYLTS